MRHAAWVIPPLVLAAVLALSASAQWGKGETLHTIVSNLGLPAWVLPTWLAPAIPGLEIVLALGLLTPWRPVFVPAAVGVSVLMLVYWALIARGLTLTPRPTCGCFGRVGDHRISWRTLTRNTLLVGASAASLALAASGRTVWSLLSGADRGDALWLGLAVLACAVTGLVLGGAGSRGTGRADGTRDSLHPVLGLPDTLPHEGGVEGDFSDDGQDANTDYVRTPIPSALLHDPGAGPTTLLELTARRAQLLVFVSCHCVSTGQVSHLIEGWQARLPLLDVHLVFSVPIQREVVKDPLPPGTLVDHAGLTWDALRLQEPSPSAVLLGTDGLLAGGPVSGLQDLRRLVDEIEDSLRDAPQLDTSAAVAAEDRLTSDR